MTETQARALLDEADAIAASVWTLYGTPAYAAEFARMQSLLARITGVAV